MLIKSADDRSEDIAELKTLLKEKGPSSFQKELISEELWKLEKGAWGEKRAAYFLDFHFKKYERTILLHDLRLELSNGDVAQIDHLIINRFLDIYILESKNWSKLTVDEAGNCTTGERLTTGAESPLEQCRRHSKILTRVFELDPELKKLAPRFDITCRVLLAPRCLLDAPYHRKLYLKADAFHSSWLKEVEDDMPTVKNILSVSRLSKLKTLMRIGERLVELHNPIRPDWRSRFGIPQTIAGTKPRKVVASVPGLATHVSEYGKDWFILERAITVDEKKALNTAGYFGNKEKGKWVWQLRS